MLRCTSILAIRGTILGVADLLKGVLLGLWSELHGDVPVGTPLARDATQNYLQKNYAGAMVFAVSRSGIEQESLGFLLPVAITALQWDCDGALNDFDREWMMLNNLARATEDSTENQAE